MAFELDTKQKRWDIETRMRDKHEIEPRNNATEENKNEVKPGHHKWADQNRNLTHGNFDSLILDIDIKDICSPTLGIFNSKHLTTNKKHIITKIR